MVNKFKERAKLNMVSKDDYCDTKLSRILTHIWIFRAAPDVDVVHEAGEAGVADTLDAFGHDSILISLWKESIG